MYIIWCHQNDSFLPSSPKPVTLTLLLFPNQNPLPTKQHLLCPLPSHIGSTHHLLTLNFPVLGTSCRTFLQYSSVSDQFNYITTTHITKLENTIMLGQQMGATTPSFICKMFNCLLSPSPFSFPPVFFSLFLQ
jgi:hypothetical protein